MICSSEISISQSKQSEPMASNTQSEFPGELATYLDLGYAVFPCGGDKRPLTQHGFKDATTDREQVEEWLRKFPGCNWAMPTAGLIVVDVDQLDKEIEPKPNSWLTEDR